MEVPLKSTDPEKIEVWAKEGEYHCFEMDEFRWANIGQATELINTVSVPYRGFRKNRSNRACAHLLYVQRVN
jgi:hypothetical protein